MAAPFLRAALAVLLISSFVFALTAEDTARFYLKSGESMKVETIAVSGTTYTLVKIDGNPSLVLAPSGSAFEPLTDRAKLEPVIRAYAEKVYASKDFGKSADLMNETTPILKSTLGNCSRGGAIFLKNFPTRPVTIGKAHLGLKYIIDRTQAYATEKKAYEDFNASFPAYNDAYQAFISKAESFGSLVAAGDTDAVLDAASVIRDSATTLKTRYGEVSTAYRTLSSSKELGGIINFTFYDQGLPLRCYPDVNATTALSRVENEFSDKSFQPTSRLLDVVTAFTAQRGADASKGTAAALRAEQVAQAESSVSNLSAQFAGSGYTVELKALINKKDALKKSLTSANTTAQAESIDAGLKEIAASAPSYQAAVAPFKTAAARVKAATDNVTASQKKYGDADARVQALTSELKGLKANMTAAISVLSSGDPAKASAQFATLAQQSSDLASRAGTLPAQGNDLNLPIIGGIVVLVLALIGTLWYFRKMKSQQPKMGSE